MDNTARVYKVETGENCLILYWDRPERQFGCYTLSFDDGRYNFETDEIELEVIGFSQGYDGDSKAFLTELLTSLINKVGVVE